METDAANQQKDETVRGEAAVGAASKADTSQVWNDGLI